MSKIQSEGGCANAKETAQGTWEAEGGQKEPQSIVKAAPSKVLAVDVGVHHSYLQTSSQASGLLMLLMMSSLQATHDRDGILHQLKITRLYWSQLKRGWQWSTEKGRAMEWV